MEKIVSEGVDLAPTFVRLGIVAKPTESLDEREGILNPACARLHDGMLHLYPRIVAPGNISRIGSFRVTERVDGTLDVKHCGYALEPQAPYELRDRPGGYGCEDPRVTFIAAIELYVMAYVAFGPRGPEIALAVSRDGLAWDRLGLMHFRETDEPFADKDAAFFPEPVTSPSGVLSLAFYHRPTPAVSLAGETTPNQLERMPAWLQEGLAIGYVPLAAVRSDLRELCGVAETQRIVLRPDKKWGIVKVGCGTPPVRIREGWFSVIHGVDVLEYHTGRPVLRYCAGLIVHDPQRLERIVYCSIMPLFVPETEGEIHGTVGHVVFPTAIDPRGDRTFDIYYGMADYAIGRGRLVLS